MKTWRIIVVGLLAAVASGVLCVGRVQLNFTMIPDVGPSCSLSARTTYSTASAVTATRAAASSSRRLTTASRSRTRLRASSTANVRLASGKASTKASVSLKATQKSKDAGRNRGLDIGGIERGMQLAMIANTGGASHLPNVHGDAQWDVRMEDPYFAGTRPQVSSDDLVGLSQEEVAELIHDLMAESNENLADARETASLERAAAAMEGVENVDAYMTSLGETIDQIAGSLPPFPEQEYDN